SPGRRIPLAVVPVRVVREVSPAGVPHVVVTRRAGVAGGSHLELADVQGDADVAEHRLDCLRDLELLWIDALRQDEVDGRIRGAGRLQERPGPVRIVRLRAEI